MSRTKLQFIGTVCEHLLFYSFFHFFSKNNVLSDYGNNEKCHVILFASLWHVEIWLNLLSLPQEPLLLLPVLLSYFCLNRDILLERLRRELMLWSLLWEESRRLWIQIRKTILVDVLPSFLLMIKHSPVIKFIQKGWILLFRLPISSTPPFYTLYIPKWSEGHFRGVVFGLSQRKK